MFLLLIWTNSEHTENLEGIVCGIVLTPVTMLRLPNGVLFWVVVLVFDAGALNVFSGFSDFESSYLS